jgi:hypothetical protein
MGFILLLATAHPYAAIPAAKLGLPAGWIDR